MLLNRKAFGEFLSKKRERAGVSQEVLAAKLGYSSGQFISNWERGTSFPPMDKLPKLAAILHIPIEELINVITLQTRYFLKNELLVRSKHHKFKKMS
jgi:transcriptional regulator with XRE-family HTH domain